MKFIKKYLILFLILVVSLFLRIYNLHETMQFIPDQGWFYLAARDMVLTGQIPLVGPPTSHPWIHHGPLWTYALGIILYLFQFDPVVPAYFMAALGALTVGILYFVVKKMFSEKTAILVSILFATSPLIVINSRIPYHTSPIPFFVVLLYFFTFLWVKGKKWVFPIIIFLLGVLYNHEITTFVYAVCIFFILVFGILTRKKWVLQLKNFKIIFSSVLGFVISMLPFLMYDTFYNGKQTVWFLIWIGYRVVKLPLIFFDKSFQSSGSNPSTIPEFFSYYTELFISGQNLIAAIILLASIIGAIVLLNKNEVIQKLISKSVLKQKFPVEKTLLVLFLGIGAGGLFVHRIPIEADTLLIAPFIIIFTVLTFSQYVKNYAVLLGFVVILAIWNSYSLLSSNYFTLEGYNKISHTKRMKAITEVIVLSDNKPFTIEGRGELSDFPVFTMPYEYLLWWKGNPITKNAEKEIIIWEHNGKIDVYEKN